ncbi:MAG TPA: N-acyl homoserine lactonase family protein [Anaerolineales bacterium]|nr:N-acyl homoserine lactonase family protein [Anaerolineales bacterium]
MVSIHPIQTGTVQVKSAQPRGRGRGFLRQVNMLLDRTWTEPLPIYAWLIEHPEAFLLVDTGETARTASGSYYPKWHPYYRLALRMNVRPDQEIGAQLPSLGIKPAEVGTVLLTHLHTDHAGGISHFPSSRFLVNEPEHKYARGTLGRLRGYLPQHWPARFQANAIPFQPVAFGPFGHTYCLTAAKDIIVIPTPGHTPGHVSVLVMLDDLCVVLAGDTTYTEATLLHRQVDGISPDERLALRTIDNILQLSRERHIVYLPSHDPESVLRLGASSTVQAG